MKLSLPLILASNSTYTALHHAYEQSIVQNSLLTLWIIMSSFGENLIVKADDNIKSAFRKKGESCESHELLRNCKRLKAVSQITFPQ